MLLLALLPPIIGFLAVGCIAFFLCTAVSPLRRFALSVSLWFAVWSVLIPAAFLPNIYILGLLSQARIHDTVPIDTVVLHHVKLLALFNVMLIAIIASIAATLHGWLIRRTTLILFRLYVTAVAVSVTFLFAWIVFVVALVLSADKLILAISIALPCLALSSIALFAWRHPRAFRATRPQRFQPIDPAEYDYIPLPAHRSNE